MAAAMGVWSSDYGIARAIVDRKINNPLSRKASQSETEEFSRANSVVKSISPARCVDVALRPLIFSVWCTCASTAVVIVTRKSYNAYENRKLYLLCAMRKREREKERTKRNLLQ